MFTQLALDHRPQYAFERAGVAFDEWKREVSASHKLEKQIPHYVRDDGLRVT